jgi:DNA-binding NarL/FixJ family response regulator
MTLRLMLVDHASILDILQTLLRGADDVMVVAQCEPGGGEWGSEALATILDRQADAILLDLRAPVMERLAALREMDGQLNPRIVILTGNLVAASATIERIRPSMPHGAAHLTARELDIVRAVASGLRNKVIAAKLRVTEGTVKVHLHNIYKKLGLDSRLSLVVYWKEHGLA